MAEKLLFLSCLGHFCWLTKFPYLKDKSYKKARKLSRINILAWSSQPTRKIPSEWLSFDLLKTWHQHLTKHFLMDQMSSWTNSFPAEKFDAQSSKGFCQMEKLSTWPPCLKNIMSIRMIWERLKTNSSWTRTAFLWVRKLETFEFF